MNGGSVIVNDGRYLSTDNSPVSLRAFFTHFGHKIKTLKTGSEILLAYEVGKYIDKLLGRPVLYDTPVSRDLYGSQEFAFVVQQGVTFGVNLAEVELADISKRHIFYFPGTVFGVHLEVDTDEEVVYNYNSNTAANRILHTDNRSAGYVSLLAYLMVRAFAEGKKHLPEVTIGNERYNLVEMEYVHIYILKDYGNKIFNSGVNTMYSLGWGYQPDWEAFVVEKRQRGLMSRQYGAQEKFQYLRKHFQVGDVVLKYMRSRRGLNSKTANRLESCHPGVITYFDENHITITYYPNVTTRMTYHRMLNDINEDLEEENKKSVYRPEDYNRFVQATETFTLTEIGIGEYTFLEQNFIIFPPEEDGSYQYLKTPQGADYVWLSTPETIYAVFEDRGVQYNKERFLQRYFPNSVPIYEQYRQRMEEYKRQQVQRQAQQSESSF